MSHSHICPMLVAGSVDLKDPILCPFTASLLIPDSRGAASNKIYIFSPLFTAPSTNLDSFPSCFAATSGVPSD